MSLQFPNVPNLPGVPQLARSLLFLPSPSPTIGNQALSGVLWHATQSAPVWGVFDSGNVSVLKADSIQDFGWRQEYRVSNFPVQQGEFASYNKVRLPFECSVIATKGGTLTQRIQFLQQVDALASSLKLYTIITPEKSYLNCNVTRAELARRGSGAACWFDVEVFFVQVVEVTPYSTSGTGAPSTANAQVASAVPTTNQGLTNAATPTTAVQTAVTQAIS
jgi:hypothetical protein